MKPGCRCLYDKIVTLFIRLGRLSQQVAILSFCLLLVSCQSKNILVNTTNAKVVRVVSGQTLEVVGIGKQPNLISQVRLIGLNAPDLRQRPWGDNAQAELQKLIGNTEKSINLEFDMKTKDQFGRTLAYVWKDEIFLNEQVLKQGYALFVARSPNHKYDDRLDNAQLWARIMGKGIWNPEKPMRLTPGEFRRLYR